MAGWLNDHSHNIAVINQAYQIATDNSKALYTCVYLLL